MSDRGHVAQTYGVDRLAALSDGVFAVAVTLLVLGIKLPDPPLPEKELIHELVDNIPAFFGWLVSFLVLARFWIVHHHVMDALARVSTNAIMWNFAFLGTISLLPFGASLVGAYEFEAAGPFVVFSIGLGLSGCTLGLFTRHVVRAEGLLRVSQHDLDSIWRHHGLVVPLVALIAAATAFLHPVLALLIFVAESVVIVVGRLRAPSPGPSS
jgi:uncharacterized membrane protein